MVKKLINNLLVKVKFPTAKIKSWDVSKRCYLGRKVQIYKNVCIHDGVSIGDYSYINKGTIVRSGEIGRYCSIGYNCVIGPSEHPMSLFSTSSRFYRKNKLKEYIDWDEIQSPPKIGHDVWIGSGVTILQGVTVGDGSIIATGAVVTKDIEPYWIYGGVPAKKIKKRSVQNNHLNSFGSNWYHLTEEQIFEKYKKNNLHNSTTLEPVKKSVVKCEV